MTANEMTDDNFKRFQDDFYDLLEKYGVKNIDCEHKQWQEIFKINNSSHINIKNIKKYLHFLQK